MTTYTTITSGSGKQVRIADNQTSTGGLRGAPVSTIAELTALPANDYELRNVEGTVNKTFTFDLGSATGDHADDLATGFWIETPDTKKLLPAQAELETSTEFGLISGEVLKKAIDKYTSELPDSGELWQQDIDYKEGELFTWRVTLAGAVDVNGTVITQNSLSSFAYKVAKKSVNTAPTLAEIALWEIVGSPAQATTKTITPVAQATMMVSVGEFYELTVDDGGVTAGLYWVDNTNTPVGF